MRQNRFISVQGVVMKRKIDILIAFGMLLMAILACSNSSDPTKNGIVEDQGPRLERIDGYTIKGIKFAYYKIPAELPRDRLIAVAQQLHDSEPDTQLILADDISQLAEYIAYVKAVSGPGDVTIAMPADWAEKHIVANVQNYMNGRFVLCEGTGYMEIADLE